jgi:FkbM family methyltransferase
MSVHVPLVLSVAGRWLRREPRLRDGARLALATVLLWARGRGVPLGRRPFVVRATAPNGRRARFALWDYIDMLVAREVFLDHDYRVPAGLAPRTIADLGANAGIAVGFFRAMYPGADIVAAEPDPRNLARLRSNVGGLPRVRVVEAAVAPEAGRSTFYVAPEGWASSLRDRGGGVPCEVECVTLRGLLPGGRADLLKVDIEGGEWPLLAAGALQAASDCLVGEVHYDGNDEADLRRWLAGFDVTVHREAGTVASFTAVRRPASSPRP